MRVNCVLLIGLLVAPLAAGCMAPELKQMQQQVDQQQAQIQRQQRELDELRAQQQQQAANATLPAPGSCDPAVMNDALRLGDAQYARGNYQLALGYYQDAAKACAGKTQVELNLARDYEALGQRNEALSHYQLALDGAAAHSAAADQAREGMARLGRP
jgi:tetratricopeptide (TPR) repeat protein